MATILESYRNMKTAHESGIQTGNAGQVSVWTYQELLYRIEVLEVCQMFVKSAPQSADSKVLSPHFQMFNAYIENLTLERGRGANNDGNAQKQRETAHGNLRVIVDDYRRRFGNISLNGDAGRYGKEIAGVIQTVLPAWIQYRDTVTEIKKEAS